MQIYFLTFQKALVKQAAGSRRPAEVLTGSVALSSCLGSLTAFPCHLDCPVLSKGGVLCKACCIRCEIWLLMSWKWIAVLPITQTLPPGSSRQHSWHTCSRELPGLQGCLWEWVLPTNSDINKTCSCSFVSTTNTLCTCLHWCVQAAGGQSWWLINRDDCTELCRDLQGFKFALAVGIQDQTEHFRGVQAPIAPSWFSRCFDSPYIGIRL